MLFPVVVVVGLLVLFALCFALISVLECRYPWVYLIVAVVLVVGFVFGIVRPLYDHEYVKPCHKAGGVMTRSGCINKNAIIIHPGKVGNS